MNRPNVDSQLRALVFCRDCRVADSGVTLLDIHDTRLSETFPATFPELWLYVSFETSRPGTVSLELQMMSPAEDRATIATSVVDVGQTRVVISPIDMSQFEFGSPGRYRFALYADGVLVGSSALNVELSPNPYRVGPN